MNYTYWITVNKLKHTGIYIHLTQEMKQTKQKIINLRRAKEKN